MNVLLSTICLFGLLVILALPLALIVAQFVTDAVRQRRQKALPTNDAARETYAALL